MRWCFQLSFSLLRRRGASSRFSICFDCSSLITSFIDFSRQQMITPLSLIADYFRWWLLLLFTCDFDYFISIFRWAGAFIDDFLFLSSFFFSFRFLFSLSLYLLIVVVIFRSLIFPISCEGVRVDSDDAWCIDEDIFDADYWLRHFALMPGHFLRWGAFFENISSIIFHVARLFHFQLIDWLSICKDVAAGAISIFVADYFSSFSSICASFHFFSLFRCEISRRRIDADYFIDVNISFLLLDFLELISFRWLKFPF